MKKIYLALTVLLTYTGEIFGQCATTSAPTNNCYYGDAIDAFILNGVASVGNSGCVSNGYASFPSPVRTLTLGGTYSFTANVGGTYYNEYFAIWIDLNNDGQYGATEMLYSSSSNLLSHTGTITIPFSATVANGLKMRLRCAYSGGAIAGGSACTNNLGSYGETEDYLVNIVCPAAPTLSVSGASSVICAGESTTLTASGAQTYSWSGGITNGSSFSPIITTAYTCTGGINGCPSATSSIVKTVTVTNIPLVLTVATSPTVICNGFTSTLTASGANNFTWTPSNSNATLVVVNPSVSTVYTVVGYNGSGCPGASTVNLVVNPSPTIAIAATSSSACANATVGLTASGADTYSWSTNSTNTTIAVSSTASAAYQVTGFSNGCSASNSTVIVVFANPQLNVTASKTLVCVGAASSVTATGNSNFYLWSNQATSSNITVNPTSSTVYTVVGSFANNCSTQATIAVNVFAPVIAVSPASITACDGASVSFTASGGTNYSWTPGGGSFAVQNITATNTGVWVAAAKATSANVVCVGSVSANLIVNPNPTVNVVASTTNICKGETATLTANGAGTYSWSVNIGTVTSSGTSIEVSPTSGAPLYNITGTDVNNCHGNASIQVKVNSCQSISSIKLNNVSIAVYPNPNNGSFKVESLGNFTLDVINELGQVVKTIELSDKNEHSVSITDLAKGLYFIKGQNGSININEKVIVTK